MGHAATSSATSRRGVQTGSRSLIPLGSRQGPSTFEMHVPASNRRDRRPGQLRHLGPVPPLLAARRAGGGARDPGPPDPLVARVPRRGARVHGRIPLAAHGRPAPVPAARRGGGAHHRQLGRVHLRGQQRPRRRQRAGLLHQPARERRARARGAARAPAPAPAGRGAHRPARRGGAHGRVRQAAVDRAHPRLLLRDVRPREEAGGRSTARRACSWRPRSSWSRRSPTSSSRV